MGDVQDFYRAQRASTKKPTGLCILCGRKLSLLERVGEDICKPCEKERKERFQQERNDLERQIARIQVEGAGSRERAELVATLEKSTLPEDEVRLWRDKALEAYVNHVLSDDLLTIDEETALTIFGDALGLSFSGGGWTNFKHLAARALVGSVNAGRLPSTTRSEFLMAPLRGEVVHYTVQGAILLKIGRAYDRGYSGVSLPIGKTGIRWHVGGSRGRVVTTGWEEADRGTFLITSHRTIFMGNENSKTVPYQRLLDIRVFSDGLEFFRDDRVKPIALLLGPGTADIAAAIVQVAAQRALGTWRQPLESPRAPAEQSGATGLEDAFQVLQELGEDIDQRVVDIPGGQHDS